MQADAGYSGWLYVLLAGVFQGSFMLPMKWTRGWAWENTWFVFAATAYLICPWLFVFLTVPQAVATYGGASPGEIATVMAMGALWGVGALTFGLGVDAVGLSIGFAVILGVASCSGTLVPLLLLGANPGPASLAVTFTALAVMILGVVVCSYAGRWKESAVGRKYGVGIAICVASGLLSSAGNIGFVLGEPIIARARMLGADPNFAPNVVWALLTISLFLCNTAYAGQRLLRNNTALQFRLHRPALNFACGFAMGTLWMLGFAFYGAGTSRLGPLGPSFGWSAMMSSMVLTANLLGIWTGEWTGAPRSSMRTLISGLVLLLAALLGLGYANQLSQASHA
jgi:L-rhamnose-H+ transport protein